MLKTITITTDLTMDGVDYEVDARAEVFVSAIVNYWEIHSIEIDCNERIVRWADLPESDRSRIIDIVSAKVCGPEMVEA